YHTLLRSPKCPPFPYPTLFRSDKAQRLAESSLAAGIQLARHTADRTSGKYLAATGGAVIVMNPNNGQVLAMASNPSYDPRIFLGDRKSTRLNSSHVSISYAVFC